MANIRLMDTNRYTAAATTVTASSAASALPVGASQNVDRTFVWRSAQATTVQTIDIDLGSVLAVTCVAVANVKLLSGGAFELKERGDAASPGAATLVTAIPTPNVGTRVAFVFFTSQSHRHWQLNWTNPSANNDTAELGFCHLGTFFEPTVNVNAPLLTGLTDPSDVTESVDGQRTVVTRTLRDAGRFQWQDAAQADLDRLDTIFRAFGPRVPIFVVLDTTLAQTAWLLYLGTVLERQFAEVNGRYDVGVDWQEAA